VANQDAQVEALRQRVTPVVAALDLELYDIELTGASGSRILRVTVARPGGVDLDAITAVTQAVSPMLDDGPAPAGPFLLEVSSPGVERTLRTPAHYAGAIGTTVSIKVRTESGTRRVHGVLAESGEEECIVDVEGEREPLAYADVTQARTVFEWGPQPRPGQKQSREKKSSQKKPSQKNKATASKGVTA
jgi:ribosome maturation factor RimP